MKLLLPAGLAFIMFALGLGLSGADFRRVLERPRAIGAGLLAQLVLLPATAWAIALALGLAPVHAAGLMILAACPGGVTAGMVTYLARGDTALSISLTALTSVAAFATVPLVVGTGLDQFTATRAEVQLPVAPVAGALLLVTVLPVALGMALAASGRLGAGGTERIRRAAALVFGLVVVATFVQHWEAMRAHLPAVGPAALLLNLATMASGAALAAGLGLDAPGRVALAMECGMQNSALGITLAIGVLGRPELAVPSVVYALLMNVTALGVILLRRPGLPRRA